MRIPRFLWPAEAPLETTGEVFLAPGQARHAAQVLRLEPGAEVEALSAKGRAPARVSAVERGPNPRLGLCLTGPWQSAEPRPGPTLAMALIQVGRFDWVVEKSVELGAAALIPLITERVKSGGGRPGEAKLSRWQRLAEEARKQCGRGTPLEITHPMSLSEVLAQKSPQTSAFFLSPTADAMLSAEADTELPALFIGPEGGFTPAEESALLAAGVLPKSLGPLTLRAETAALAALARLVISPQYR